MTTRPKPAKPSREQLEAINSSVHYAMFSAFALTTPLGEEDRDGLIAEVEKLFAELTDSGVRIRGVYDVAGLRADADVLIWWHADEIEQLQDAYKRFLRTELGAVLDRYRRRGAGTPGARRVTAVVGLVPLPRRT